MKKTSNEYSAFAELRRQKAEALRNIRKEQELMRIYSSALTSPLRNRNSIKTQTPMKSLFNTISTANYTWRLIKGFISVFKILH